MIHYEVSGIGNQNIESVLVSSGDHNKRSHIGKTNSRNLSLTVLEAGSLRLGCEWVWFFPRSLWLACRWRRLAASSYELFSVSAHSGDSSCVQVSSSNECIR